MSLGERITRVEILWRQFNDWRLGHARMSADQAAQIQRRLMSELRELAAEERRGPKVTTGVGELRRALNLIGRSMAPC